MKTNWQTKKLGEICELLNGFAFKSSDYSESGFFVIRIGNVQDGYINLDDPKYIKNSRKDFILDEGDILISLTGNVGRVGVIKIEHLPAVLNQRVAKIKLKSDTSLNKSFLLYFLKSDFFIQKLISYGHGAAQQNVSIKDIEKIDISFPSLSEQKRIVKILDEAFEKLQKVKENTEKNLQNSKGLFESYLNNIFSNSRKDLGERRLEDVCEISSTLIDPKKKEYSEMLHIGAGNMLTKSEVLIDLKTANEERLISGKFLFDTTMVLYSKIRPYLMKVLRPKFDGLCSADIYPLKPLEKFITRDYLFYILLSKDFTDYAIKGSARAGMPKVNREHLFAYTFYLPSITEQNKIVKKLDRLSEKTQKLESLYKQKLESIEGLKKSILSKAFSKGL